MFDFKSNMTKKGNYKFLQLSVLSSTTMIFEYFHFFTICHIFKPATCNKTRNYEKIFKAISETKCFTNIF